MNSKLLARKTARTSLFFPPGHGVVRRQIAVGLLGDHLAGDRVYLIQLVNDRDFGVAQLRQRGDFLATAPAPCSAAAPGRRSDTLPPSPRPAGRRCPLRPPPSPATLTSTRRPQVAESPEGDPQHAVARLAGGQQARYRRTLLRRLRWSRRSRRSRPRRPSWRDDASSRRPARSAHPRTQLRQAASVRLSSAEMNRPGAKPRPASRLLTKRFGM